MNYEVNIVLISKTLLDMPNQKNSRECKHSFNHLLIKNLPDWYLIRSRKIYIGSLVFSFS